MPAPKIRENNRIARLISIAYLLSTRKEMHIDELVERTGTDRKTIESDLNTLMFCGLPPYSPSELFDIIIEDDFVSMYFNEVFVSPLRLNETEKTQAVIALKKLEAQVSNEEREAVTEVLDLLGSSEARHIEISSEDNAIISLARKAIEDQVSLEIEYLSLNSASLSARIIEPIRIFTTASISYIYAYSYDVEENRIFRSDRMLKSKLRDDIKIEARDSSDAFKFEPTVFRGTDESYVDLFIEETANWILDSYPNEISPDHENAFRFPTRSPYFAARLLMSYPQHVRYVAGTISKDAIVEAINKIHKRMNETATTQ